MSKKTADKLAVVVLAAGKGSRMKSNTPKVLHKLAGRELILHVLDAVAPLQPAKTIVITGHEAEDVEACINTHHPHAQCIRQHEQNGTGHAVLQAEEALRGFDGTIVILNGDVPLIQPTPLATFLTNHNKDSNAISVASTVAPDPTGLGRILRDDDGTFTGIREHKDATDEEQEIDEVNVGFYAADAAHLFPLLHKVGNNNAQGEYYLPDIVPLALAACLPCEAHYFEQPAEDLTGINNRSQLAMAEIALQDKLREQHMANGVTLTDPATVYFAWDTEIAPDVTIEPGVIFGENVQVASNVTIKAYSYLAGCFIDEGASLGPFARIRPESHIGKAAEIGNFVEINKSHIGDKSKAKHLTYVGWADVGHGVNIGAGTITANYHAVKKQKNRTILKDGVATGAHNTFVAPVTVHENAMIGAGTTVRHDVAAGTLVTDKPEQIIKPDYNPKK